MKFSLIKKQAEENERTTFQKHFKYSIWEFKIFMNYIWICCEFKIFLLYLKVYVEVSSLKSKDSQHHSSVASHNHSVLSDKKKNFYILTAFTKSEIDVDVMLVVVRWRWNWREKGKKIFRNSLSFNAFVFRFCLFYVDFVVHKLFTMSMIS